MFTQLLESRAVRKRSPGGTAASIVFHATILGVAVWATARATEVVKEVYPTVVYSAPIPSVEPTPVRGGNGGARSISGVTTPTLPTTISIQVPSIPDKLPDISQVDLSERLVGTNDFAGRGIRGAGSGGGGGGTGAPGLGSGGGDALYDVFTVEKPVRLDVDRSPRPAYPSNLRQAGVTGYADVRFIVDSTGRYRDGSFSVVSTTNDLFAASVRAALPRMRFFPAEANGQKVAQRVQQTFQFTLSGN